MASNPEAKKPSLRWGRALAAAILGEVALIIVAIPIFATVTDATPTLNMVIPPASFVVFLGAGYWSAKSLHGAGLQQGALTGLIAVVFYIALGFVASRFVKGTSVTDGFTLTYLIAHALKIIGSAIGGSLVARKTAS